MDFNRKLLITWIMFLIAAIFDAPKLFNIVMPITMFLATLGEIVEKGDK